MAGNIAMHPAPGLGDLMPDWWNYPNDPDSLASRGITKTPGIRAILPAAQVAPENPLKAYVTGQTKMIGQGGGSRQRSGNVSADHVNIGDIVATGAFPVPNNQFTGFVGAPQVNGQGVSGLGCGGSCGGGCGCDDCGGGLGQVDFSSSLSVIGSDISAGNWSNVPADIGTMLQSQTVLGVPLWGALIAGYFLWDMLTSHKVQVSHR
jgi:hypothetical protein